MKPDPAPDDRKPAPRRAPGPLPQDDDDDLPFAIYIVIKKIILK
jgi:hypothetical protein